MKRVYLLFLTISLLIGCDNHMDDDKIDDNGFTEIEDNNTLYQITKDIDDFESIFLAKDGYCLAIKKDTTFGFVAVIDSLRANDKKSLVVYIDSSGKVRRLFNNGKSLDISYNDDGYVNLWYRETNGTSEVFNKIKYTSTKAITNSNTKAGEVFDPMDIVGVGLTLWDLRDIGDAVAFNQHIADGLKANILADLLTTGPFSNTTTEIITGVTSIAITAIIGTSSLPLAALLATIGIADAAISDWQNSVAYQYFDTAMPITGDAVQLTKNHFVISYSINSVNPNHTDFNIGVIIADGLFITKNHHLLKKSISYNKSDTGYFIVNLKELGKKKGDKLKYRIYLEPANDNGFKWDDKLLDYWRYGEVKDFMIDEPALKVESAVQTDASSYHGYKYTFSVDVSITNTIPFYLDEWGVAIYSSWLEECTSEDDQYDLKSIGGKGNQTISFSIDVNDNLMNTEETPYVPFKNYFAVPYISFDGQIYYFFDNSFLIYLQYITTPQIRIERELIDLRQEFYRNYPITINSYRITTNITHKDSFKDIYTKYTVVGINGLAVIDPDNIEQIVRLCGVYLGDSVCQPSILSFYEDYPGGLAPVISWEEGDPYYQLSWAIQVCGKLYDGSIIYSNSIEFNDCPGINTPF